MTSDDTVAVLKPDSLEAPPLNEHELKTHNEPIVTFQKLWP